MSSQTKRADPHRRLTKCASSAVLIHILVPWSRQNNVSYTNTANSLVAPLVKNLPAVQETWIRSLGWEEPLEKEMAIHCSVVAWRIPWTEEPGGLQSIGWQESVT